jgi:hypothetical protein
MMPLNSVTPLATAIPKHSGIATRKTTMEAGASAISALICLFIFKLFFLK